jgi:hypothetical protein
MMKTEAQPRPPSSLRNLFVAGLLCLLLTGTAEATGIVDYGLTKAKMFSQLDPHPPQLLDSEGFLFVATVEFDHPGRSVSGSILLPNGQSRALTRVPSGVHLYHTAAFDTEDELHAAYPYGNYTFQLVVDGAPRVGAINLASRVFPPGPHLLNYDALQSVDPDEPLIVQWAPIPGGATSGLTLILEIGDYSSPKPGEIGSLTGAHTSIQLAPGTLAPGQTHDSGLYFTHLVDLNTTAIPGAAGVGFVGSFTNFEVVTTGDPNGGAGGFEISTRSLPDAILGEPYLITLVATEPVAYWGLDDPAALPPGIYLNPMSGMLFGAPSEAGSFTFSVFAIPTSYSGFHTRQFTVVVTGGGSVRPLVPKIARPAINDGTFSLQIESPNGDLVVVEVSTDLIDWTPIGVLTPVAGVIDFQDPDLANHHSRFYRVRWEE